MGGWNITTITVKNNNLQ